MAACCTLVGGAGLASCGGAQRSESPHARFAALQVAEARLERALSDADAPDCDLAVSAAADARAAAVDACAIADAARDPDARTRCERARSRAGDAHAAVQRRCAPSAEATPETSAP